MHPSACNYRLKFVDQSGFRYGQTQKGLSGLPCKSLKCSVPRAKRALAAPNQLFLLSVGQSSQILRSRETLTCYAGGFGALLKSKQQEKSKKCPCGGGEEKLKYDACCKKYHDGDIPPDPETLMKARYSAYALKKVDFIMATTHDDNPAREGSKLASGKVVSSFRQDVQATCKKVRFIKLEVEGAEDGSDENEAFVTFRAHVQVSGQNGFRNSNFETEIMKEKSRFLKSDDGKWLYVDGDVSYED